MSMTSPALRTRESTQTTPHPSLVLFCPMDHGGIVDYTHMLANALVACGSSVTVLSVPGFPRKDDARYVVAGLLPHTGSRSRVRWWRRFRLGLDILLQIRALTHYLNRSSVNNVLFSTYAEYLAPLWSWRLQRMAHRGTRFGAVLHDPVRDYIVGPVWWHHWSVRQGYAFLQHVFVHDLLDPNSLSDVQRSEITIIPHGPFRVPHPLQTRAEIRAQLGIPDTAQVVLAFGQIRDGKNLDQFIRIMPRFPNMVLLVAGLEALGGNRPAESYRTLAQSLGVADRCRWVIRYIKDGEIGGLFTAADLVLLTYSARFRSASGVLNLAVSFRKPCLASAGEGNLKTMVNRYQLGIWSELDDAEALSLAYQTWLYHPPTPKWDQYENDNSWQRAAQLILSRFTSEPVHGGDATRSAPAIRTSTMQA